MYGRFPKTGRLLVGAFLQKRVTVMAFRQFFIDTPELAKIVPQKCDHSADLNLLHDILPIR